MGDGMRGPETWVVHDGLRLLFSKQCRQIKARLPRRTSMLGGRSSGGGMGIVFVLVQSRRWKDETFLERPSRPSSYGTDDANARRSRGDGRRLIRCLARSMQKWMCMF